jgi:hypothetical protein
LRAAKRLDRKRGIQHFTSFAGELTDATTTELVEDAYRRAAEQHVGVGRVIRSRPLKGGGESTDILIVEDGAGARGGGRSTASSPATRRG